MPPSMPAPPAPLLGTDPSEAGLPLPSDAGATGPETALAIAAKDPASAARPRDAAGTQGVSPTEESG